jgi:hypothetical protein
MNPRFLLSLAVLSLAAPLGAADTAPVAGAAAVSVATATVKTDALKPAAGLKAEVKVGTDIVDKEPVGVQENFPAKTETLVAWSRVTGAQKPITVTHVWIRNGDEVKRSELKILSSSYRTHSSMTVAKLPGNWTLEVRDQAGKVIGSTYFNVMDK